MTTYSVTARRVEDDRGIRVVIVDQADPVIHIAVELMAAAVGRVEIGRAHV